MKWLVIGFIRAWRFLVSPLYGDVCKFYPTCSAYGLTAVRTHGALKGGALAVWRILRCNPWSHGGYDPVPGTSEARLWALEQAGIVDADWVPRGTGVMA
ncbi:MAG: membrane protein insertion efficiency factor YidD [Propionibacteriaceae bacterium]|jgi:putative membrane protein insertion efficiency factor|nr:membrane protein insertion efficiency factor YidD [Propionibacteriaceae bacterium]